MIKHKIYSLVKVKVTADIKQVLWRIFMHKDRYLSNRNERIAIAENLYALFIEFVYLFVKVGIKLLVPLSNPNKLFADSGSSLPFAILKESLINASYPELIRASLK